MVVVVTVVVVEDQLQRGLVVTRESRQRSQLTTVKV